LYDVIVIGGGPTGSQVAYRLAGMGHGVVVVEQKESLAEPVCCTGIIGQECVNAFSIDENVISRQANSAKVFSPSGKLLNLWRQSPQACIVNRSAFNEALAKRAQAEGVEYLLNSQVNHLEIGADRVRVRVEAEGHEPNILEARAAVIAAGAGSKLVKGLGLGRIGDFVVGAQAEVDTNGVDEVEVYLGREIAPAFFAWLVPTSPGKGLVGLISRRSPAPYLQKLLTSLMAQGKITLTEVRLSYDGMPLKPLNKTYGDRLVVVGSAAGQVKPITGGGIYYGLLCADIAADNLHQALKNDDLSAKNLVSYEKGWKRRLGRELRLGYWARKFFELLSDKQIDRIFDLIKANGIDKALLQADDVNFDWHGRAVLKLLGHQAFSKAIKAMKLPLPSAGKNRRELDNIYRR